MGNDTVSDNDVLNAVDDADGTHDGDIATGPRNDVQAILYAHGKGDLSVAEAVLALVNVALVQKGLNEGGPADWSRAAMALGPDVVRGIVKLAGLLA